MAIVAKNQFGQDPADFIEDTAAERVGERIRMIREARQMTRAELGLIVGLTADRIQKYENGARRPKIDMLKEFASVLGVETIALMDPIVDSYVGAMHSLFRMEEELGLAIIKTDDGRYCLQFGDGRTDGMNRYLAQWYEVRQALDDALPNLSGAEREKKIFDYNMFEWTYPAGIAANAHKKYDEHIQNRMQEIRVDAHYKAFMEKLGSEEKGEQ